MSLAVDAAGNIFVADDKPVEVMRYDPTGRYVGSVGREGEGPGEYRSAWLTYRGDTLVVHDPSAARAGNRRAAVEQRGLVRVALC